MSSANYSPSDESKPLTRSHLDARLAGLGEFLPRFNGTPEDWPLFYRQFRSTTATCGYTNAENVLRLRKHLQGKAYDAVRYLLIYPSTLELAIERLEMRFGTPKLICFSLLDKLDKLSAPNGDDWSTVKVFGFAVEGICRTIVEMGHAEYLNDFITLQGLEKKLPVHFQQEWFQHKQTLRHATLAEFGEWEREYHVP
uniref:Uncharacterized protein n=1 Tax=Anopheles stephensi TaxID=30069 RepID=A0A182YBQ7_ANOST